MKINELVSTPEYLTEHNLMEMTNLVSSDTGLKYVIWVGSTGQRHGPRIKVSNFTTANFAKAECFTVVVSKDPYVESGQVKIKKSDLEDIFDWVKTNYDTLIELDTAFNSGNSVIELLNKLAKI